MATISERKNSKGEITFQVKIRIKGCPVVSETFKRITDARKWAKTTETEIENGRYFKTAEAKKHTLAELIDRYVENVLPRRKSDYDRYKMQLNWWKNKIGCYLLSDITPALLSQMKDQLQKEPYKVVEFEDGTRKEKYFSDATANRYMAALSIVLTKASREWGWMEENPMFKVEKHTEAKGRTRYLSDEERTALLKACQEASNPLINLLVVIALSTGARFSEIINLKWDDVDMERKVLRLMDTKNGEHRAIPISTHAHALLSSRYDIYKQSKVRKLNSDYVFARPDGKKPIDIRHQWEKVIEKSNLKDFRFHDLRHTAASYLAMNGATLVEISEILGHKTMQMVKRYSHMTIKHTADVLERMNEKQFASLEVKVQ